MNKFITSLDEQFVRLHRRSSELIAEVPLTVFYQKPPAADASAGYSGGEALLRSAAIVEQTFGGITVNLWDDAFEWTLPETLATKEKIFEYLDEVEATRQRGFMLLKNDADLLKEIMAPAGPTQLVSLLLDTLARAAHHQGAAAAIFRLLHKSTR